MLYSINCRFIDHICKIRTYCSGCRKCDFLQIDCLIHLHIFRMNLQDFYTSFQIWFFNNDTSVKTSRS